MVACGKCDHHLRGVLFAVALDTPVAALSRRTVDVARFRLSLEPMLISVVIPAYHAAATIARAVTSLLRQTWTDWEGIVVSDDGTDYAAVLRRAGIADERLRFVSTGRVGSGCHRARNVGLAAARGELIAA